MITTSRTFERKTILEEKIGKKLPSGCLRIDLGQLLVLECIVSFRFRAYKFTVEHSVYVNKTTMERIVRKFCCRN
jgi:L-amino acid N-acyltransferase YncA